MIGVASVMLAGGIAGANVYASDGETEIDESVVGQNQELAGSGGHHGKRGHFEDHSEDRELRMATAEKKDQLIDLLLDQDASSVDGVDELQKELADLNSQLDALKEKAEAAHEEKEAKMQEWKDSEERPELTEEEKAANEEAHKEMEANRDQANELVNQKNEVLDQLIEKLS